MNIFNVVHGVVLSEKTLFVAVVFCILAIVDKEEERANVQTMNLSTGGVGLLEYTEFFAVIRRVRYFQLSCSQSGCETISW